MVVGWAINSAMILMAATTFFQHKLQVTELQQANAMLKPLLGNIAVVIFAVALLFSGLASSVTSGMAGGSIFSGFFSEPYDIKDNHSRSGVFVSLFSALLIIFIISNPYKGLIISQMVLSIQLPFTIFLQIYLTSSRKVMGKYANSTFLKGLLLVIGLIVSYLNIYLLMSLL
jgi:manganese transport protein